MTTAKIPEMEVIFDNSTVQFMNNEFTYLDKRFKFALCSLPTKTKKSQQLTQFHHCRDGFLQKIVNHFRGTAPLEGLSTAKTAIMFRAISGKNPYDSVPPWFKGDFTKWMLASIKAGVKLVNHFEKENGWRLSKLYKVKTPKKNSVHHIYMIHGSRWWMLSTYTLSLFILLIRLGVRKEIHKLGNLRKMESIINKISSLNEGPDSGFCKCVWKWTILLNSRKDLFNCKDFGENYKNVSSGYDGLYNLTSASSISDKEFENKFTTLCNTRCDKTKNK